MQNEMQQKLQEELDNYLEKKDKFSPYYEGMNIFFSTFYKEQLESLKKELSEVEAKSFELYLDTIIVNMHTKLRKYKQSIYFDNEDVKDIQNQGLTIPFFIDEKENTYILLGILKPETRI